MKEPRILFSGYFGFGNFGDDAILYCMARQFKKMRPEIQLSVLTNDAEDDVRWLADGNQSFGVKPYKRMKPVDIVRAIKNCDLFISGGGGLFQDTTSVKSVAYYAGLIHLALRMKKKVMIFSQGLGPLNKPSSQKIVSSVLRNVHDATFRDEASCALAKKLSGRDFECVADPVFLLTAENTPSEVRETFRELHAFRESKSWKNRLGISLRSWKEPSFFENFYSFLERVVAKDTAILFFPFCHSQDGGLADEIISRFSGRAVSCPIGHPPPLYLTDMAYADIFLCMRYHSALCAFLAGKPALGFSYDPKVRELFDAFGLSEYCLPLNASSQDMCACYEKLMLNRNEVVEKIKRHLPVMKERALKSFHRALHLIV